MKINILTEETIGKIAAGEVVERPASVVKELIENSIDAGAGSIEIEVQAAGQSLIRVADDGEGMTPEDAKVACQRHATSKIRDIDDLESVSTMGFRGEALASIAAVSQMDLASCAKADEPGVYIYLENGRSQQVRPAGRARGTTIEVRNLFYNVPARRKFLKKEATELAEIVSVVGRFILVRPDIEFKLTQAERCLLHATRDMGVKERIRLVLGGDVSDEMVDVSIDRDGYSLTGYVSRPSSTRKDKRAQVFFINGRYVRSRVLGDAVYDAYRSLLERGRYPAVAIFLTIPSREVDVNVHPTKLQVKFGDERAVRNTVAEAIKGRFERIKRESQSSRRLNTFGAGQAELRTQMPEGERPESPVLSGIPEVQDEFEYNVQKSSGENGKDVFQWPRKGAVLPLAEDMFQVGSCYIVQIKDDSIMITDQHAAHERVLYEFFTKAAESGPVEVQNLLFPVRIDLSADETVIMEKTSGNFEKLGFHIEPFGERSFAVQAVPAMIKDRDVKTVIYDVLTDLASRDLARIDVTDELVKLMSCRAAIKAGDAMSGEEMAALLDQLLGCELPFTCPHGRPTMSEITADELEKRFRRK